MRYDLKSFIRIRRPHPQQFLDLQIEAVKIAKIVHFS